MPDRIHQVLDNPDQRLRATDLFPELSDDIDRRIMHAETRIKNWVIGGVLANLVALVIAALPLAYQLGQIQQQSAVALSQINKSTVVLEQRGVWMQQRELWEAEVETFLRQKGFQPGVGSARRVGGVDR